MPTIYNGVKEIPNRRGEYLVNIQFSDGKEVCHVHIDHDVDECTGATIETAYSYIVTSENRQELYTSCYGFSTVSNAILAMRYELEG